MMLHPYASRLLPVSGLALVVALSLAQVTRAAAQYEPSVGQEGKDVVWVPTNQRWSTRCSTWPM